MKYLSNLRNLEKRIKNNYLNLTQISRPSPLAVSFETTI